MIYFLSKYKIIFYIINLIFIFIYLFPGSIFGCFLYNNCQIQPQLTSDFFISSNHFYAFTIFSIIGLLTYKNSKKKLNLIKVYLILSSISLEILHLIIPNRSFEITDLFGNLTGVVIVLIINFCINYEKFKN